MLIQRRNQIVLLCATEGNNEMQLGRSSRSYRRAERPGDSWTVISISPRIMHTKASVKFGLFCFLVCKKRKRKNPNQKRDEHDRRQETRPPVLFCWQDDRATWAANQRWQLKWNGQNLRKSNNYSVRRAAAEYIEYNRQAHREQGEREKRWTFWAHV